ncbi:MAG: hypothetical protein U1B94_07960 [candidate division NC10 bacterium]|nr:hypothetical protein [candidate division NC10 bacterium]
MKGRMRKLWGNEEVATCKLCGTPIKSGKRTCPLCGYVLGAESNVFYIAGDASGRRENKGARASAPPAPAGEGIISEFGNGRGLDEEVALMAEADGDLEVTLGAQPELETESPVFRLDPPGLRELLATQPEMLEPGLKPITDKSGKPVGAGFSTAVGTIDLLAWDKSGAFVVVMVAEPGQGEELVRDTLQRVGWVRKHLGNAKQPVRGIVLIEGVPEKLSYAAAAVADTLAFKTYRMAVRFEDVEA